MKEKGAGEMTQWFSINLAEEWVWLPEPTQQFILFVTPLPRHSMPSSGLQWHPASTYMVHIHTCRQGIHTYKANLNLFNLKNSEWHTWNFIHLTHYANIYRDKYFYMYLQFIYLSSILPFKFEVYTLKCIY